MKKRKPAEQMTLFELQSEANRFRRRAEFLGWLSQFLWALAVGFLVIAVILLASGCAEDPALTEEKRVEKVDLDPDVGAWPEFAAALCSDLEAWGQYDGPGFIEYLWDIYFDTYIGDNFTEDEWIDVSGAILMTECPSLFSSVDWGGTP